MGRQALTSHQRSKKHNDFVNFQKSARPITNIFVVQTGSDAKKLTETTNQDGASSLHELKNAHELLPPHVQSENSYIPEPNTSNVTPNSLVPRNQQNQINNYLSSDFVVKAEILWNLQKVDRHFSLRDIESSIKVMEKMFPDSNIAKKLKLSKSKASYNITYGLRNFFEQELIDLISLSDEVVVGFDESLNSVSNKQQMDIVIRFWNDKLNEVSTRYLTSAFLGKTKAVDLLTAFEVSIPKSIFNKIIQISMDGPNVNLRLLKRFARKYIIQSKR